MSTGVRQFLSCIVRVVTLRDTMLTVPTLYSLVVNLRDAICDTSVIHWIVVTIRDTTPTVLLGCLIGLFVGTLRPGRCGWEGFLVLAIWAGLTINFVSPYLYV